MPSPDFPGSEHALFTTDTAGRILTWNRGVERFLGYSPSEWIGQQASLLFTPKDCAAGVPEQERAKARAEGQATGIRWHVRKDGTRVFAEGFLTPLYDHAGNLTGYATILRDATTRRLAEERMRRSEEALRVSASALGASEEQLAAVIGTAMDGILIAGEDQRIVSGNPSALEMFGYQEGEVAGQPLEVLMPERFRALHGGHVRRFGRSGETRRTRESFGILTARRKDGTEFPIEASVSRFQDSSGRTLFAAFIRDISERVRAETALRESEQRFRALVDAASQIVWTNSPEGRMEGEQPGWATFTGQHYAEYQGFGWADAVHPDDRQSSVNEWNRCVRERVPFLWEHRVRRHDGVYRIFAIRGVPVLRDDGAIREWVGIHTDVTEQREEEQREHFLADLSERTRGLLNPDEATWEAMRSTGEFLQVSRCVFVEVDEETGTLTARRDWTRPGVASAAGTFPAAAFGASVLAALRAGKPLVVPDVDTDERIPQANRAAYAAIHTRALVSIPIYRGQRWVGILGVNDTEPRDWSGAEVELLQLVAERTWLTVENARLFRETQARAEREALLNLIGDGIRQSLPPEEIEALAIRALGQALGADRCYVFTADAARDTLIIAREWCAEGVRTIAGHYRLSAMGIDVDAVFGSGESLVVPHLQGEEERLSDENAAANDGYGVTSLVNVPFYEKGRFVGALAVAMARGVRQWSAEEVALTETVAGQLRSTLEAARLQQRERTIAEQLQAALQPPAVPLLPGMALASFYRPALQEAGVGGDFYDVFAVTEGRTALVVADLSGKGLAAAQQVAIVKNMLRFALYGASSVSAAITTLHQHLVEHDLLHGFATLFVGLYDHIERTLTYVNCGQEPGLLRRAGSGAVEKLAPTGPVLGSFGVGGFEQEIIALAPGDLLALFTDGLTEVGPTRQQLLGVDGVVAILQRCHADGVRPSSPETAVEHLIARVDAFAQGGVRDDIALLVGVVGT